LIRSLPRDKCVVLVELKEKEVDPDISFPYFVTTSSRDAESIILKTLTKDGGIFFLSDPHTFPEVYFVREISSIVEPDSDAVPTLPKLRERVAEIGCILRYLFANNERYLGYLTLVNGATNSFFKVLDDMTEYNIPTKCKFFLAPVARKGIPNTKLYMQNWLQKQDGSFLEEGGDLRGFIFKFHSENLAQRIGSIIKNSDALNMIELYGLTYQLMERKVLDGAFLSNHPSFQANLSAEWLMENWNIFEDHSDKNNKTFNEKLRNATIRANTHFKFPRMVLKKPAHELNQEYVYQSMVVNGKVYDLMVVNHELKRVYLFQLTAKTPKAHPISMCAFKEVLEGLGMLDESSESSRYKIVYTMVVPKFLNLSSSSGKIDFVANKAVVNVTEEMKEELKLDQLLIAQMEF
jgi:hypothetical protein